MIISNITIFLCFFFAHWLQLLTNCSTSSNVHGLLVWCEMCQCAFQCTLYNAFQLKVKITQLLPTNEHQVRSTEHCSHLQLSFTMGLSTTGSSQDPKWCCRSPHRHWTITLGWTIWSGLVIDSATPILAKHESLTLENSPLVSATHCFPQNAWFSSM